MFRCVECGCEYDVKPDFCDCGNDVFEEVIQKKEPEKSVQKEIKVNAKIPTPAPRIVMTPPPKQPDPIDHPRVMADVVLLICIILSVSILFFIGNPKKDITAEAPKQTEQKTVANIPNVDSFWDNTPPTVKPAVQQTAQQPVQTTTQKPADPITIKFEEWLNRPQQNPAATTQQKPVQQSKPAVQTQVQKPVTVKTVQPQQHTKVTTVQSKPQVQTAQKPKTTQTAVNTTNAKTNSPGAPNDLLARVQQNIKYTTPTTTTTKTTTTQAVKTQTTTQTPKTVTTSNTQTQTQTAPALRNATKQPVKSQAQLNQEVASYKASLRNNIGKKINFLNVVGDGSCAITFKVDSSGKLTNRNFSSQSSNITLNDAVYNAMMSTPSFNPPPEGYKNETMTLRVKIYDGNYEVTLN